MGNCEPLHNVLYILMLLKFALHSIVSINHFFFLNLKQYNIEVKF